ncbi:MAG: glycosyltransferase [Candidatus Omnitrophica bacterium]|nr:glycosyltransferase [Candidatus Omnitrophota bacterium]
MQFISVSLWCLFAASSLVWLYRSGRALFTLRKLPVISKNPQPESHAPCPERVSILVPAKNEEKNIAACLESLVLQDYEPKEIFAIDNESSDRTPALLASMTPQIQPRATSATPGGWTGKNYALHHGSLDATGDWLLFTDADTRHKPAGLRLALAHAQRHGVSFLTLLPEALMEGFCEHLIQPAAMCYIGLWFPIERINDPTDPLAFANGQYLLIRRKLYESLGRHESVREAFLEDFALMKKAKQSGAKVQCALGTEVYGTRMYDNFESLWKGWRRIYLHAFEQNPVRLLIKTLNLLFFSALPFFIFMGVTAALMFSNEKSVWQGPWGAWFLLNVLITTVCMLGYGIVRAPIRYSLVHSLAALILSGILWNSFWIAFTRGKTSWR